MRKRKVTLVQSDVPASAIKPGFKAYLVVELRGTVEFDLGQRLSKAEVEAMLGRPGFEVVVRGEGGRRA